MKQPNGGIDLIGTGMQLGLGIVDLIKEFAPDAEQREDMRRKRLIKVAIRQLKHRYKGTKVDVYVKVNFANYTEDAQLEIIDYIRSAIGRD